ncbi:MAG: hypothetical protein H0X33_00325 [Taibaiella sp.]|nr:hypothetical protein [Taibaiella sp.]
MKTLLLFVLVLSVSLTSYARQGTSTNKKARTKSQKTVKHLPTWASTYNYKGEEHLYFEDYNAFYDPKRGGYVFQENGKWSFTPTVPPYMSNADLNKTHVKILKGLSLDLQPELNYPQYMKLGPTVPGTNLTPVPGNAMPNSQ